MRLHLRRQFLHLRQLGVRHDLPWREIACARIDVPDPPGPGDLPLAVPCSDLVSFSDVGALTHLPVTRSR